MCRLWLAWLIRWIVCLGKTSFKHQLNTVADRPSCQYTTRILSVSVSQGRLSPQDLWRKFPPNLIGHRSFVELDFSPWGNCKRRRREAAIAEGKKPLAARGLGSIVSSPTWSGAEPQKP